jgi:predicted deacylase
MDTIEIRQYRALAYGPRLLVLGAVHGNETCGPAAIRAVAAEFANGRRRLARGVLTLVPVANPVAFRLGTREGDRNLNRDFRPCVTPECAEDRIANHLAPLLGDHDALLDLHSFNAQGGEPFVFLGPADNDGDLEPFRRAAEEARLARAVGPRRLVYGWLPAYARGATRRPGGRIAYGVGTTEYMRSRGGYAVTVECGQHADPAAPVIARNAIENAIALLGLDRESPAPAPAADGEPKEVIEMFDVVDRQSPADRFLETWRSFEPVEMGQPVARRADGEVIVAPERGYVVFPSPQALPGREWFYFARPGQRR